MIEWSHSCRPFITVLEDNDLKSVVYKITYIISQEASRKEEAGISVLQFPQTTGVPQVT